MVRDIEDDADDVNNERYAEPTVDATARLL